MDAVMRRLAEIQQHTPWLLPAAVAGAMVSHPQMALSAFAPFVGTPSPRVSDDTLRNLAKLTSLSGVTPAELKAYINLRFHALTFAVLTEAQVRQLLETFEPLGAQVGPLRFAEHVRTALDTGTF